MKPLLSLLILSFNGLLLQSQNLVLNPSFEDYSQCPDNPNSIEYALFWSTPTGSTDWYHPCALNSFWSVPLNSKGYQEARTGVAYAGFGVFVHPDFSAPDILDTNFKEYLSTILSDPMVKDSFYRVSLFLNASNDNDYSCDCLEIWLTDYLVQGPPYNGSPPFYLIEGNSQLTWPEGFFFADTLNWVELCWLYKAQGGEQFMTIGSFKGNTVINAVPIDSILFSASTYFYVEDVAVEKVPFQEVDLALGPDRFQCQPVFSDTLSAGGNFDNFLWSTGDTTQSIVVTQPGLYWVEGSNGFCSLRDSISIFFIDPLEWSLGDDLTLCPQDFPWTLHGPDLMDSYAWNTGDSTPFLEVSSPGIFSFLASYPCGTLSDTISIQTLAPPVELGEDTTFCGLSSFLFSLHAPPGYDSYLWNTGDSSAHLVATAPGLFWVHASNLCGVFSDSILLQFQPLLDLDLGPNRDICLDSAFQLHPGGGFEHYLWNTGDTASFISPQSYGWYWVQASYICGLLSDSVFLGQAPPLLLSLPPDTTISLGNNLPLIASVSPTQGALWFSWSPPTGLSCADCPEPIAAPLLSTSYTLEVLHDSGCRAVDSIFIHIVNPRRVFLPNSFSPNGDGVNDQFALFAADEVELILKLDIFDRWGGMVFQALNIPPDGSIGWDGQIHQVDAPPGTYIFYAIVLFKNGEQIVFSGDLTLIR